MSTHSTSRFAHRLSISFIFWISFCAILIAAGGVTVAVFKNQQVAVRTEINKMRKEISVCRMNANQYRSKANAETNRWVMLSRLNREGSTLHEIERGQIEIARSSQGGRVASAE